MPRQAKEMTVLDVRRLTHPGAGRNVTIAVGGVSGLLFAAYAIRWAHMVIADIRRRQAT